MIARLCFAFLLLCSGAAQAGYSPGNSSCFAELGEAITSRAGSACSSGSCRLLSYSPSNAAAVVIIGAGLANYSISPCETINAVLPSGSVSTPWYGSDPGTVSSCGSTVNTNGGLSGSGSGYVDMTPAQKSENYADGLQLGWSIASAVLAVWGLMMIGRAFRAY